MPYYLEKSFASDHDFHPPEGMHIGMINDPERLLGYVNYFSRWAKDKVFLDVGAGLGLIGIRALEHGAKFVYFVEQNKTSAECLAKILAALPFPNRYAILNADFHSMTRNQFSLEPNILVCELWGPHLWNEGVIPTYQQAKSLFPKITMVPGDYRSEFSIVRIPPSEYRVWPREQIPGVQLIDFYKKLMAGKLLSGVGFQLEPLTDPQNSLMLNGGSVQTSWETTIERNYSEVFFLLRHKIGWPEESEPRFWRDTLSYVPEVRAGQQLRISMNDIYVPRFEIFSERR
jgi:hypothetical protein